MYVRDAAIIDDGLVVPTRDRYNFAGWYDLNGKRVRLSDTPIVKDTVLVAHWEGPVSYSLPEKDSSGKYVALKYTTSSAALNIVWKDYDNAFGVRPSEVMWTLKSVATGAEYSVRVTKKSAEFVGNAPKGATIAQGGGNWTVKITGLTEDYTFLQDGVGSDEYTTVQSGTTVVNTLKNYDPERDDTSALMTENGRLYDLSGNVVVLKGVVTLNVGWQNLSNNTSQKALTRLLQEGVNCIRVTVMTGGKSGNNGYWLKDNSSEEQTPERRAELLEKLKTSIDNASAIGMYCIIDWGISMGNLGAFPKDHSREQYLKDMQPAACEMFSTLAKEYADNPYVIYEVCNEPAVTGVTNPWGDHIRVLEENITRAIREAGSQGLVIAGPNMYARNISEDAAAKGDDPIDKPFSTEIAYNVAYTFHSYPVQFAYQYEARGNGNTYNYGWRLSDAIKAGLTIVVTEFNPGSADKYPVGDSGEQYMDIEETNKFLNVMLENDVSFMFFRYVSGFASDTTSSQEMFKPGYNDAIAEGVWTVDMFNTAGKWFYDNALNSTGFIKAADFDYVGKAAQKSMAQ